MLHIDSHGKVLQATRWWFQGFYVLETLLPLLLECLLFRAHGRPLGCGLHYNGYVESQLLRRVGCWVPLRRADISLYPPLIDGQDLDWILEREEKQHEKLLSPDLTPHIRWVWPLGRKWPTALGGRGEG